MIAVPSGVRAAAAPPTGTSATLAMTSPPPLPAEADAEPPALADPVSPAGGWVVAAGVSPPQAASAVAATAPSIVVVTTRRRVGPAGAAWPGVPSEAAEQAQAAVGPVLPAGTGWTESGGVAVVRVPATRSGASVAAVRFMVPLRVIRWRTRAALRPILATFLVRPPGGPVRAALSRRA